MEGIDRTALAPADAARVHESDEPETTPLTSTVDDAERAAAFDAPSTAARSGHVSASATSDAARDAAARTRAHELAAASARQGGVPASEPKPEHSRGVAAVFAGLLLAMFVSTLSETVTATALPTIVGDLGGVDHMQWVTTAYILASTVMMPIYGKLGDLFGRKYLFIIALSIFIVGSATCGLAPSMDGLIAGRAVEGLGGGGLIILAQATIADIIPPRQRGKYMGLMGVVFAVSTVVGPLLGGWFVAVTGWRWLFAFNIPLALLAIAAVAFFLTKPVRPRRPPAYRRRRHDGHGRVGVVARAGHGVGRHAVSVDLAADIRAVRAVLRGGGCVRAGGTQGEGAHHPDAAVQEPQLRGVHAHRNVHHAGHDHVPAHVLPDRRGAGARAGRVS